MEISLINNQIKILLYILTTSLHIYIQQSNTNSEKVLCDPKLSAFINASVAEYYIIVVNITINIIIIITIKGS